jgi:hypothetical protein
MAMFGSKKEMGAQRAAALVAQGTMGSGRKQR